MRPIFPYDLQDVARALMMVSNAERPALAQDVLRRAVAADAYRRKFARPHPEFGHGTISGAARSFPLAPLPWHADQAYLSCIRVFLTAYLDGAGHKEP